MADDPAARERSTFPSVGESTDDIDGSMDSDDEADRKEDSSSDGGADDPFGFNDPEDPSPTPPADDSGGDVGGGADTPGGFDDTNNTGQTRTPDDSGGGADTPQGADDASRGRDVQPDPSPPTDGTQGGADTPEQADDQTGRNAPQQPTPPRQREAETFNATPSDIDRTQQPPGGSGGPTEGPGTLNRNPGEGATAPEADNEVLSTVASEDAFAQSFADRFEGVEREDVDITRTKVGGEIIARVDPTEISESARAELGIQDGVFTTDLPSDIERSAAAGTAKRQAAIQELEDEGYDTGRLDVDVTDKGVTVERLGETETSPAELERASASGVRSVNASRPQTVGDVEAQLADRAIRVEAVRQDTGEQFGDIAVTNPLTGDRLENDLKEAAEPLNDAARVTANVGTELPGISQTPIFGPLLTAGRTESQVVSILERRGVIDSTDSALLSEDPSGDIEGPLENTAEESFQGAASAFNPFSAAREGKEIVEFGVTQPPRIADAVADSTASVSGTGVFGENIDVSEQERFEGGDDFVQDVQRRAQATVRGAESAARSDPVGAGASAAGGIAGGVAAGTVIGGAVSKVPGISGSDISGRVLAGTARRADDLLSDTRGQAPLTGPGRVSTDSDSGIVLTGDDIDDIDSAAEVADAAQQQRQQLQFAAKRAGQRGRRQGFESEGDVEVETRVVDTRVGGGFTADDGPGGDFVASQTPQSTEIEATELQEQASSSNVRSDADLSPRERQLAAQLETPADDLRTITDVESRLASDADGGALLRLGEDPLTIEALGASVGSVGAVNTQTGSEVLSGVDADIAARSEAGSDINADTRIDSRADTRIDTGLRQDTRLDGILEERVRGLSDDDFRVDIRQDVRQDTRVDPREDPRIDTRQDIRFDTREDLRFDTDIDIEPESDEPERPRRDGVNPFSTTADAPILSAREIEQTFDDIDDDIGGF